MLQRRRGWCVVTEQRGTVAAWCPRLVCVKVQSKGALARLVCVAPARDGLPALPSVDQALEVWHR